MFCPIFTAQVRFPRTILMILVTSSWILPATLAQDSSTSFLRGTVSDNAGANVNGASVVLVNTRTGIRYSRTTALDGGYYFDLLPPGDYSARAEAMGMSPELSPGLHL
jgi:Carboxypeptidase regulatory-like domain